MDQGVAKLVPGVLFMDEVKIWDIKCFIYLNRYVPPSLSSLPSSLPPFLPPSYL